MPEFESGTLAIGLIFPYNNPVSDRRLDTWLSANDYNKIEKDSQRALNIGPGGVEIEGEEGIAKKEDVHLLYQPNASLDGYSNSSFLTLKNTGEVDFESVLQEADSLYSWLDEEVDAARDISTFELTIDGLLRVGRDRDLSKYFSEDVFEQLQSMGGHEAAGVTAQFVSRADPSSSDWYRVLIDKTAVGNPNLWRLKSVLRYDELDEIGSEPILSSIGELIDYTEED